MADESPGAGAVTSTGRVDPADEPTINDDIAFLSEGEEQEPTPKREAPKDKGEVPATEEEPELGKAEGEEEEPEPKLEEEPAPGEPLIRRVAKEYPDLFKKHPELRQSY